MEPSSASGWLLSLRQEFTRRPLVLLFVGCVIGISFASLPWNLAFLLGCGVLASTAPARLWLAIGFCLGVILPVAQQTSSLAPEGPVKGLYAVQSTTSHVAVMDGPSGKIFVPLSRFKGDLEVGDTFVVDGDISDKSILTKGSLKPGLPEVAHGLQSGLNKAWESSLSLADARLLGALTLGQTGNLTEEDKTAVERTGTYTLISTSGLQVFSLAWVAVAIFSLIPAPLSLRLALCFGVLVVYLAATGWHAGTWRAVAVCGLAWLAPFLKREFDALSALAFASVVYLIFFPGALYLSGFIYTTVAVAGWCFFPLGRAPKTWRETAFAIGWMWLVLTPLSAQLFGRVSLTSVLAGPVVLGLSPIVIIGSFLGAAVPMIGQYLVIGAAFLARMIISAIESFGSFPIASINVPPFSGYFLVPFYGLLLKLWRPKARLLGRDEVSN